MKRVKVVLSLQKVDHGPCGVAGSDLELVHRGQLRFGASTSGTAQIWSWLFEDSSDSFTVGIAQNWGCYG